MPQSDYYHGANTHRSHNHSLHSLPMAENNGKKSIRTFFDFSKTNASENVDAKCSPQLLLTQLRHMSKLSLMRFLLGLTLTFLIMASYVLMWDKGGLFFASPPYQIRSVPFRTNTTTVEVSPVKNVLDMQRLVTTISSKLRYTPRKVPSEKNVKETDSHLFSVIPPRFSPAIKSPCWYEEFPLQPDPDPYARNLYTQRSRPFKAVCETLRTNFTQHLLLKDGKHFRLRCLPYFYIVGQPKCGTTDLFHRLLLHPEVQFNIMKEPHWWTRKRFGYIRFKDGFQESFPVEDYLDLFDLAARNIQIGISGNSSGDHGALQFITGEASASTMWDNQAWSYVQTQGEEEEEEEKVEEEVEKVKVEVEEPPFLAQDFIHTVQPDAKIIIMLRDPGERLYSDYLYFKMANKSAEDFHEKVVESMLLFQSCLFERSLRSCAYNSGLSGMPVRLNLGLYIVFLLDWLTVFHREQILILRLEDYAANLKGTIKRVFDFLSVGPLSEQMEAVLTGTPTSNTRREADTNLGPMLPATRTLLQQFHWPFNLKLASELNNTDFLWSVSKGG